MLPILSSRDLVRIFKAINSNLPEIEISLDLGLSKEKVKLSKNGFYISDKLIKIPKVKEKEKICYVIMNGELKKVQFFSDKTKQLYKLVPTEQKPILQISNTSMHKKPFVGRIEKDKLKGKILDSGTGLGYTAIAASKTAEQVITVEFDENVLDVAKLNPYSQDLFKNANIKLVVGDVVEEIKKFKDCQFDYIIFDASTPKSSGGFFSFNNYREAYRVLKNGGKIYHYLPRHHVMRGRDFGGEVIIRMKQTGFVIVERNLEGSYVIAQKP